MMNPDKFDALLRASDPAADRGEMKCDETLVSQTRQQWTQLALQRRRVRRRVMMCLAATVLFAVVGVSTVWRARHDKTSDRPIASATSPERRQRDRTDESVAVDIPKTTDAIDSPADPQPNLRKRQPSRSPDNGTEASRRLAEFATFVDNAGKVDSPSWLNAREYLARQDPQTQRQAIYFVPQLPDKARRLRAFELVCKAAGNSHRDVLKLWVNDRHVGQLAWNRLIENASLEQTAELIPIARHDAQRMQICSNIASDPASQSIEILLELARNPVWRASVGSSASDLQPQHIQSLIMSMRRRSASLRTAAAFMLASVPGNHVDQVVAKMILNGRYRQPAYLVLLSRDTPQARAFLAQAASNPDLTPALVSARMHFANIQQQLYQWIAESRGTNHEPFDNTHSLAPERLRGGRAGGVRSVRLDDDPREFS